ncbi:MAG: hypothetical protein O7B35_00810, partial [Deltaproteobacteria bacterium]|nr:hypothetical protein [Deltaproteobacteria bacterium]
VLMAPSIDTSNWLGTFLRQSSTVTRATEFPPSGMQFSKKLVRLYEYRKAPGSKSELEQYREPEEIELDLPN